MNINTFVNPDHTLDPHIAAAAGGGVRTSTFMAEG